MQSDNELIKGTITPIVLKLLDERRMYGYEIVQVVKKRTGGLFQWKEGTLYPCLHSLEAAGLVTSAWQPAPNGKNRKYYSLTRRGRAELARRTEQWAQFAKSVNALLIGETA